MAHIIADRVKETSTTTGTGALTLSGAITGYQAFSAACAVGDTLYYALQAVDASGVPTGDWECGLGTYSAANTLTRTTVTSSSNAGAAVSLAVGTKQVYLSMPAVQAAWPRERLTANRTYYVRTDGSDSNTGLADTAGAAFLTIQKAIDVISGTLDLSIFNVTVQLADGTYTGSAAAKSCVGNGYVMIQGNATTPANTIISTTSADAVRASGCLTEYRVKNLKLQTTTGGYCLAAYGASRLTMGGGVVFGASAAAHIYSEVNANVSCGGLPYSITGGATVHYQASFCGYINAYGANITLTGTPNFSVAFCFLSAAGVILTTAQTFTGSATGKRYDVAGNSVVQNLVSTTYLPGNVAGTTSTGGQYI